MKHHHNVKHNLLTQKWHQLTSLDQFVLIIGVVEPFFTIPQLIQIFSTKNAQGLSIITWLLFVFSTSVLFYWGVKRKLKPIYIPQAVWLISELIMIYGIIMYG